MLYDTWLTPILLASWVDYGAGLQTSGYRKTRDGRVFLRGLIRAGTATDNTVIMTLPEGYRPTAYEHFPVATNSTAGVVAADMSGNLIIFNVSNIYLSLGGISFSTR